MSGVSPVVPAGNPRGGCDTDPVFPLSFSPCGKLALWQGRGREAGRLRGTTPSLGLLSKVTWQTARHAGDWSGQGAGGGARQAPGDARSLHQRVPPQPGPPLGKPAAGAAGRVVPKPGLPVFARWAALPWPGPLPPLSCPGCRLWGAHWRWSHTARPSWGRARQQLWVSSAVQGQGAWLFLGPGAVTTPSHQTLSFRCLFRG
jgi:hypothetical protein